MERVTEMQLRRVADLIAKTRGIATGPVWSKTDGNNRARVGALIVEPGSKTNGIAWKLAQVTSATGAEADILRASTAGELFELMHAYLKACEDCLKDR